MAETSEPAPGAVAAPVILDPTGIERLPWRQLHGQRAAVTRVLWQQGDSLAGIIRLDPGEELPSHAHAEAHHHVWVLTGTARILGEGLPEGSYVHIPAGVEHAVAAIGPEPLTMLYLYLLQA